jgi:hypothetical protein
MSDTIAAIGDFMSSGAGKGLTALLGLAGAGTNIYSGIQNTIQNQRQAAAQKYVQNLVQNPTKMAAAAAGYTQPLTAGLTEDIENTVQGSLAERGLGSSPAAYTQQLTQALAPYIQQNQQAGQNALLSALGLIPGMRPATFPMTNLAGILKQLQLPSSSSPANQPSLLDPNTGGDPLGLNAPPPVTLPPDPGTWNDIWGLGAGD